MAIQGIEGVISQLQATAMTARNQNVAERAADHQLCRATACCARPSAIPRPPRVPSRAKFTLSEPGVALNDRMTDLQKASVSLQMGDRVRNKLVSAYQEVMGMQV